MSANVAQLTSAHYERKPICNFCTFRKALFTKEHSLCVCDGETNHCSQHLLGASSLKIARRDRALWGPESWWYVKCFLVRRETPLRLSPLEKGRDLRKSQGSSSADKSSAWLGTWLIWARAPSELSRVLKCLAQPLTLTSPILDNST